MASTERKGRLHVTGEGGREKESYVEIQQGVLRSRNESGTASQKVVLGGKDATVVRRGGGAFELLVQERLTLRADSGDEADKWIQALREQGASVSESVVDEAKEEGVGDALRALGPMTEPATGIEFPSLHLATGDVLAGVGPRIKKIGFLEIKVYAVALYVDPLALSQALLPAYKGASHDDLCADPAFYRLLADSPSVSKTLVLRLFRSVGEKQMSGGLAEDLVPRLGPAQAMWADRLAQQIRGNVTAGEEVCFSLRPSGDFVLTYKGVEKPPLRSPALCKAILDCFFDEQPLWQAAKEGLVQRVPVLLSPCAKEEAAAAAAPAAAAAEEEAPGKRRAAEGKQGWLRRYHPRRTGLGSPRWTPRWCVLDGNRFSYSLQPDTPIRQSINLHRCVVKVESQVWERSSVLASPQLHFAFSIDDTMTGHSLRLSTDNVEEWRGWVAALGAAADRRRASASLLSSPALPSPAAPPRTPAAPKLSEPGSVLTAVALLPPSQRTAYAAPKGVWFELLCAALALAVSALCGAAAVFVRSPEA